MRLDCRQMSGVIVLYGMGLLAVPLAGNSATAARRVTGCAELVGLAIPAAAIGQPSSGATVTRALLKPGTGRAVPAADYVPEFCLIDGVIRPVDPKSLPINFRVVVPTAWNGGAIQIGGNGFNGFIPRLASFIRGAGGSPTGPSYPPDKPFPVAEGYALYGSDSGHVTGNGKPPGWSPMTPDDGDPPLAVPAPLGPGAQGGPPPAPDFRWMGDREALENYAHAQIKKTHDVAQLIIATLRGKRPTHSYFMGESQGGRDALVAASVYGDDYDGVLASVPLSYFSGLLVNGAWQARAQFTREAWLPPAKAPALVKDVVAQYDALDGLADGVINNYLGCYRRYDAAVTPRPFAALRCAGGADTGNTCFSDLQIGTLEKIFTAMPYGFPLRNGESDWPGNAIGGKGMGTGDMGRYFPNEPPTPAAPGGMPVGLLFGLILGDANGFDYFHKSHAELQSQLQAVSAVLDAPVDWSRLLRHGGKLLLHSAGNDFLTNSRSHQRVFEQAVRKHGQASIDRAVRFYVTPNGDHGSAGISSTTGEATPRYMDLVGALTRWVEQGTAPPDAIEQQLMATTPPYAVSKSRPLCRYPRYPHYQGSGDPILAQSYRCTMPASAPPAVTAAAARIGLASTGLAAVGEAVQRHVDAGEIPGAVVLIARHGQVAYLEARGRASSGAPLQTDTVFWAASMTKPIVATAVMMMVDAGKLALGDPVSKFIPEFSAPRQVRTLQPGSPRATYTLAPAARALTVQDLLTHTSGLQSIGVPNDTLPTLAPGDTLASFTPKLATATLEFQPGSRWAYSNATGFDVLARIVEVASGQDFRQFVQRRILDPLDMRSTSFGPRADLAARTLQVDPAMAANPCISGQSYVCGSAGLWTSAVDYAHFTQLLLNRGTYRGRRLLRAESVAAMTANQTGSLFPGVGANGIAGADRGVGFGLGMIVVDDNVRAGLALPAGSYGWDGVGTRRFWAIPRLDMAIVMLVPSGTATPVHRDIERAAIAAVDAGIRR